MTEENIPTRRRRSALNRNWFLSFALQIILITPLYAQSNQKTNWPSFRGSQAAGVAENQNLPDKWDGAKGTNIKWKTRIPGLAHSSPIVWGNRVFVVSAISSAG